MQILQHLSPIGIRWLLAFAFLPLAVTAPADPLSTRFVQKVRGADTIPSDHLGFRSAVDGDLMVVGAFRATHSNLSEAGVAYIFRKAGGATNRWLQIKKLVASDAAAGDFFGFAVAIQRGTVVVTSRYNNERAVGGGAAYVFERHAGGTENWGQVAKLTASDGAADDNLGRDCAIEDNVIVVTTRMHNFNTGAAYLYERNGVSWPATETVKLTASDGTFGDLFGQRVDIDCDWVAIGAHQDDDQGDNSGSVYLYQRDEGGLGNWGEVRKIAPTMAGGQFGRSLALEKDTLLVGAYLDQGAATSSGSAYVFERQTGGANNWGQTAKLIAPDGAAQDRFGNEVALSGDTAVICASFHDGNGQDAGAAYVFHRTPEGTNTWSFSRKLTAPDGQADDRFGVSAGISGANIVVGAWHDDSTAGAAYLFERVGPLWVGDPAITATNLGRGGFGWSTDASGNIVAVGSPFSNPGTVILYQRQPNGSLLEFKRLQASDGARGDHFGISLSLDGDTLLVGADESEHNGVNSGKVYIFVRDYDPANPGIPAADHWGQFKIITNSTPNADDLFGSAVELRCDTAVIAAEEGGAEQQGVVHVLGRHQGGQNNWGEIRRLEVTNTLNFGSALELEGDTLIVGARNEPNAFGTVTGAAYVFERHRGGTHNWGMTRRLIGNDTWIRDSFGQDVSISADVIAVGAPSEGTGGSVYFFERHHGGTNNWGQFKKLTASDGAPNAGFGRFIALRNDRLIVSASGYFNSLLRVGKVYEFRRDFDPFTPGVPTVNSWGEFQQIENPAPVADDFFGTGMVLAGNTIYAGAPGRNSLDARLYRFRAAAADHGDAPSSYPVTLGQNGARHAPNGPLLGNNRDAEADGKPSTDGLGDDGNQDDDEDGVTFGVVDAGNPSATVSVVVSGSPGKLDAWIDFNANGSWDPAEQIAVSLDVAVGTNALTFPVPADASLGVTHSRFRLSEAGGLDVTGAASNGEVEDHPVNIQLINPLLPPLITMQPVGGAFTAADQHSLRVVVYGERPFSYQWQRNGINLSGATNADLLLDPIQLSHAGSYRVIVSNAHGTASSTAVTVTVAPASYSITWTPVSLVYGERLSNTSLNATATIPGVFSYTPPIGTLLPAGSHNLQATFTPMDSNIYGGSVNRSALLNIGRAPLQVRATDLSRQRNQPNPTLTVSYSGFVNNEGLGVLLTHPVLSTTATIASPVGSYPISISAATAQNYLITHVPGTLEVRSPVPVILTQPSDHNISVGATAGFSVVAGGDGPIQYQWRKNGTNLPGQTGATLQFATSQPSDVGSYDVVVSNPNGNITSRTAALSFEGPPTLYHEPDDVVAALGGSLVLSTKVVGTAPFSYVWIRNGTQLPNANSGTLQVSNLAPTDAGAYRLIVANSLGMTNGRTIQVTLLQPPSAIFFPTSRVAQVSQPVSLIPHISGSQLNIQWFKNGSLLPSESSQQLQISEAHREDSATYRIELNSPIGTAAAEVHLRVIAPPEFQSPRRLLDGRMVLNFAPQAGTTMQAGELNHFSIQRSQDFRSWITISTNGAGMTLSGNRVEFTDNNTAGTTLRFYRILGH